MRGKPQYFNANTQKLKHRDGLGGGRGRERETEREREAGEQTEIEHIKRLDEKA